MLLRSRRVCVGWVGLVVPCSRALRRLGRGQAINRIVRIFPGLYFLDNGFAHSSLAVCEFSYLVMGHSVKAFKEWNANALAGGNSGLVKYRVELGLVEFQTIGFVQEGLDKGAKSGNGPSGAGGAVGAAANPLLNVKGIRLVMYGAFPSNFSI